MVAAVPAYTTLVSMNEGGRDEEMKSRLSLVSSTPSELDPMPQLSFKFDGNKLPQEEKSLGPGYEPGKFDVICSKGKEARDHTGNKRFRMLIDMNLHRYREAKSKVLKSTIVTDIVDSVTSASTGGFIKMIEGEWHQVSDHHAREKVGQSFRDRLHTEYKSSSKAKIRKRKMEEERMLRLPISSALGVGSSNSGSSADGGKGMAGSNSSAAALPNDRQRMMTPFDNSMMNLHTSPIPISSFASSSSMLEKTSLPDYTSNMVLPQRRDISMERINGQRSRSMFQRPIEELSSQSMLRNNIIGHQQQLASRQLDMKMSRQMMFGDNNPVNMNYNDRSLRSLRSLRHNPVDNTSLLLGGMFNDSSALRQQNYGHSHFGGGGGNSNISLDMPTLGPVDCFMGSIPSFNQSNTMNRIQQNNGMRMQIGMEATAAHPGRGNHPLLGMNTTTFDINGGEESVDNSREREVPGNSNSSNNNNTQRHVGDAGTNQEGNIEAGNNKSDIPQREDSNTPAEVEPTSTARREASLGLLSFSSESDRDFGTFSQEIFGDIHQQKQKDECRNE